MPADEHKGSSPTTDASTTAATAATDAAQTAGTAATAGIAATAGTAATNAPTATDPGAADRPIERVCFRLRVRPDRLAEYRERHARVWPQMLREIEASGRRNYSLFLDDAGTLIGYFETDSLERSDAYLAASETAARWEAEMAPFFDQLDGRPDQGFERLPEIFNLADQLASTGPDHADTNHAQKDMA